jgi:hypothetical protein
LLVRPTSFGRKPGGRKANAPAGEKGGIREWLLADRLDRRRAGFMAALAGKLWWLPLLAIVALLAAAALARWIGKPTAPRAPKADEDPWLHIH